MPSTRQTTSYLKGLAILMVLVTHYSFAYASGFNNSFIRDYAVFVVSIFFVLSGYGNYYSMQRLEARYGGRPLSLKLAATFFWQRALRIYPLFWLSLFSASFLLGVGWNELHELSPRTVATYLAFPTVRHEGYTWFIPALVQCYLAAPLLYYLQRKLKLWRFVAFIFVLGAASIVITVFYHRLLSLINGFGVPDPDSLIYKAMFLSNILLFAGGLCMPLLIRYVKPFVNYYVTLAFFAAFLLSMYLVRDELFTIPYMSSQLLLFPLFLISVSGFCLSAIAANQKLPLSRAFAYLGTYSFTLYLFHWQYFVLLEKFGLLNFPEWLNAMVTAAFFPVLLGACVILQKADGRLRIRLSKPAPAVRQDAPAVGNDRTEI